MNCWKCDRKIDTTERVGFRDYCPGCDRPLHACRNCEFYDPAYHNQCRETVAELVVDKDRANFCDYFSPRTAAASPPPSGAARGKLEDLFRKKQ